MPLFLFPVRLKIYIYQKLNISQMGWWMHPWRTLSVFVMEKMIILGPSHLRHWHKSWATPSRLWSPTCGHPVILLYRRLRMQVRYTHIYFFFFFYILYIFILNINIYFVFIFYLTGVIQELQLKMREHCYQVTTPQNFRPAPGTVCCAQFSGTGNTTQLHLKVVFGMLNYWYFSRFTQTCLFSFLIHIIQFSLNGL